MDTQFVFILIITCFYLATANDIEEADREDPHRDPSKCEVCKIFTIELQHEFDKSKDSKQVIDIGHQLDARGDRKKRVKYRTSEMRFIEATENVCEEVLKYSLHAERQGSRRFAKGMSETFKTLHGLVDKGVKVELGIPFEMWDQPSAEITVMKKYCEQLLENHEEDLEEWYFNQDETPLIKYLCQDRALGKDEVGCLAEEWTGRERVSGNEEELKTEEEDKKKKKKKSKKKKKTQPKGDNETENDSKHKHKHDDL